ncbi:MAG TPA: hypothetical protein VGO93_21760 [Candidatus Xenobia bacterium]
MGATLLLLMAPAWSSPTRLNWIQTNDGRQSQGSFGFIQGLTPRFLMESWATFPSDGAGTVYTLKFDYVVPMK